MPTNQNHRQQQNSYNGNNGQQKSCDNKKNNSVPNLDFQELTDKNYVELAEKVIDHIIDNNLDLLTTSKIRSLLSLNSEIYNMVICDSIATLNENVQSKLRYLKVKMIYESGREKSVMLFVKNAYLVEHLDKIGNSREKYLTFARYMEALVAYRKFKGGKDS